MKEGADMLMVKPGLPYLDIVREVKNKVITCLLLHVIFRDHFLHAKKILFYIIQCKQVFVHFGNSTQI